MNIFAFCLELEYHPNSLHLIAGYTSGTAGALIYKSDGLGIERYFAGRCRPGKYEEKPAYYIQTATGEKIIMRAGGKDILSQDFIAGYTFGMAYITEANRCNPEFIKEVFARTFSSQNRKIYHDINPKSESHWYYEEVLAFHDAKQKDNPDYGFNYGHFTMADNLSMSDEQIRDVIKSVPKGTVWYMRDILGQRKQAEGLIYPMYDANVHKVETLDRPYENYIASIDYGIQNPFVICLWGMVGDKHYLVKEYYHSGRKDNDQKTDDEYYAELEKLVGTLPVKTVIIDPSATSFITLIRRKKRFFVKPADNSVIDGIRECASALQRGLIFFNDCCVQSLKEFDNYQWNPKSLNKDEPIKENDHFMDAMRYYVKTVKISSGRMKRLGQ